MIDDAKAEYARKNNSKGGKGDGGEFDHCLIDLRCFGVVREGGRWEGMWGLVEGGSADALFLCSNHGSG